MVYVISKSGKPLMPCKEAKARHLLRDKKAKVVKKLPFIIQLTFDCEEKVQEVSLGVDSGSKTIGISVTTRDKVLFEGNFELRNDIVELLSSRREARRTRRNRKTRYRRARFNNRKKSDKWLAPSIRQKIDTHLNVVKLVHKILPISKIIVEVASFDIQKIKNPNITNLEYQEGEMSDFWNVREYVLFRDGHKCQCCKGKSKDDILNVHHIESRKTGGNAPSNLITLCETCHKAYHKGEIELPKTIKRGMKFNDATFMSVMRWGFYNKLKEEYNNINLTYGYITKNTRINNGLNKDHYIDARCISGNVKALNNDKVWYFKKIRRHNRQLYKDTVFKNGYRKKNQCAYEVFGYHRYDLVKYNGKLCYINSLRTRGVFILNDLLDKNFKKEISYKKIKLVQIRNGFITNFKKGEN